MVLSDIKVLYTIPLGKQLIDHYDYFPTLVVIREYGSTLNVELARAVSPTNTNFRLGAVDHGDNFFLKSLSLFHCVPLHVCRLCINFQDLCARLLGMAALLILLLTFTVIDFLSIRKVIIFSAIATDDRHPLWSCSIHQNAANCMTIRFRYIAQLRGVRKTYCARSRNDVRRLTSRSNGMPSKKLMESLEDVCLCRNCSKARPNVSR